MNVLSFSNNEKSRRRLAIKYSKAVPKRRFKDQAELNVMRNINDSWTMRKHNADVEHTSSVFRRYYFYPRRNTLCFKKIRIIPDNIFFFYILRELRELRINYFNIFQRTNRLWPPPPVTNNNVTRVITPAMYSEPNFKPTPVYRRSKISRRYNIHCNRRRW